MQVFRQNALLVATDSRVSLESTTISSVKITQNLIRSTQSELALKDVTFFNVTSETNIEMLLFTSDSVVTASNIAYTDSNTTFIVCLYSMFSLKGLSVFRVQILEELIYLREIPIQAITRNGTTILSSLSDCQIELTALTAVAKVRIVGSEINRISNVAFLNIDAVALMLDKSTINSIEHFNATGVTQALYLVTSKVGNIKSSSFTR